MGGDVRKRGGNGEALGVRAVSYKGWESGSQFHPAATAAGIEIASASGEEEGVGLHRRGHSHV